jgi:hypothetical protein
MAAMIIEEPWVAMGDDGSVLIEDDLVLLGPHANTIDTLTVEALNPITDDFRLMQGNVVLYDAQLQRLWYHEATQTWFPETQTGAFGGGNNRKIVLTGSQIFAKGGNHVDPIQVSFANSHGNTSRTGRWLATVEYFDGRERVYRADRDTTAASTGVALLWPAGTANNTWERNPNPPGATYIASGEFPIDARLPLPWNIPVATTFPTKTAAAGLYGEVVFGPFDHRVEVWSWHVDPAGIDDDLVINGEILFQNNFADIINGGQNTLLADIPPGTLLRVDINNAAFGPVGGSGTIRVVPAALS